MATQSINIAMTQKHRIVYFLLLGLAFAFLGLFISRAVMGIVAENLATAGFALGIGWSLNDKTKRLSLSKTSYLALCAVYLIVANLLALLMSGVIHRSNEGGAYYLLLLTAIAYVFSWIAIKASRQIPGLASDGS